MFLTTIFLLVVATGLFGASPPGEYPGDSSEFQWVRGDGNIDLYARWIPATDDRKARQLKAEFHVNAEMEEVIRILADENLYLQWMKAANQYYRVKTVDESSWYAYVQFSIPWPLKNQDCVLHYEVIPADDRLSTVIRVTSRPDYLDNQAGVERIAHMEVTWVVMQTAAGSTRIEYYAYSNQPPKFPTWITDPIIQKNTIKTMSALQELCNAGQPKYASS